MKPSDFSFPASHEEFRFGSLFAGIGGIDLGLEWAGMVCRWQVEIDPFCQKVLAKHWPDVPRFGDVKDVGKHNLETVDLICGGFPCQPHSLAGKRRGAEDDRNLWPEFSRVVAELRPCYVLAENVLGIVTTYLDTVLSDLESQAYTCATFNIPACAFNAPHRRERIFIVAYTNSGTWSHRKITQETGYNPIRWTQEQTRGCNCDVPNTHSNHRYRRGGNVQMGRQWSEEKAKGNLHNRRNQWSIEPNMGRVTHGIPNRVDRLRALGNAVVPQVAEWIGQQILIAERKRYETL